MARQSFFRGDEPKVESKYGAASTGVRLTSAAKAGLLLAALLIGGGLGSAYAFVYAGEVNKTAREKLSPVAELRKKREKERAALQKKLAETQRLQAEAAAAAQRQVAERLAQVNPLRGLLGAGATTGTATARAEDAEERPRTRPRATPRGKQETTLQDVAAEARRMLQTGQ